MKKPKNQELIAKVAELDKKLAQTEWLHEKENITDNDSYVPFYGDVTKLNTERIILDTVGKEMLKTITSDLMDLLNTSVAVYEKNGDYAFGIFNSGWCRLLDASSRKLCNTDDNKTALNCGKWLCHEDCWNNSAKAAIDTQKSTDIDCIGGIKLYGEPIFVGNKTIGAINLGYGNPPTDNKTLKVLAEKFNIDFGTLKHGAIEYKPRPHFIIDIAKKRMKSAAKLIGEIVSRKQAEQALKDKNKEYQAVNEQLRQTNEELSIAKIKAEESEDKFKTIFNMSQSLICIADINTSTFKFINPAFERILGYSEEELLSKPFLKFIHPDDVKPTKDVVENQLQAGISVQTFENRYLCKNGNYSWLNWSSYPIPERGITYAIAHDITELKESEQAIIALNKEYEKLNKELKQKNKEISIAKDKAEKSEANVTAIIEGTNNSIWAFDRKYRIIYINETMRQEFYQSFGVHLETGMNLLETLPKSLKPLWKPRYDRVLANEQFTIEDTVSTNIGTRYIEVVFNPIIRNEEVIGGSCFGNDITERKKVGEALENSHELMRYVIEHTNSAIAVHDKDMRYVYVSQSYLDQYKVKDKEIIGKHHYDVFPDLPQKWRDVHKRVLKGEILSAADDPYEKEDGSTEWTRWECRPWYNVKGDINGLIVYTEVITEEKKIRDAIKESEEKYRVLAENARHIIITHDLDGKITYANKFTLDFMNITQDQIIGESIVQFIHFKEDLEAMKQRQHDFLTGKKIVHHYELTIKSPSGKNHIVEAYGNPIIRNDKKITSIMVVAYDITGRKRAEKELAEYRDQLENLVKERTKELEEKNKELEEFNNLFVGREFRIKELKDTILELKAKLNQSS